MNHLFDESFSRLGNTGANRPAQTTRNWFALPADVQEDDNHIYLAFELPGITAKDVKITLENNVLTAEGERKAEKKSEKGNWLHQECYSGTFSRSFTLQGSVESDSIEANFHNGVLEISIEKKAEAKPKQIQIGVGPKQLRGKSAA
jgi:HSP20 family protein